MRAKRPERKERLNSTERPEPIEAWIAWPGDVDAVGPLDYRPGEIITTDPRGISFDPANPPMQRVSAYLRAEYAIKSDGVWPICLLRVRGVPAEARPPKVEFESAEVLAREPITAALGANRVAVEQLVAGLGSLSPESMRRLGYLAQSRGCRLRVNSGGYLALVQAEESTPGYMAAKLILRTGLSRRFEAMGIPPATRTDHPAWAQAVSAFATVMLLDLYGRSDLPLIALGSTPPEIREEVRHTIGVDLGGPQLGQTKPAQAISLAAATGTSTSPALDGLA